MKKIFSFFILTIILLFSNKVFAEDNNQLEGKWSNWIFEKIENENIPDEGFLRIIFDSNTKEIIKSENSETITLFNYIDYSSSSEKGGIGVYWVGNIEVEKDGYYDLTIYNSWSKLSQVYIDDELVADKYGSEKIKLNKGEHKIEVQFINGWHVASFLVNLELNSNINIYKDINIFKEEEKDFIINDYEIYTISTYESKNKDGRIDIYLKYLETEKDFVLHLNSFSPVNRVLKDANPRLKGIIYTGCGGGSLINGEINNIKLIRIDNNIGCNYKNNNEIVKSILANSDSISLHNSYSTEKVIGEIYSIKNDYTKIKTNISDDSKNISTKKGYKLVGINGYEIYYWLELDGLSYISYNGKLFGGFNNIPDEPILTDDGKVIMVGDKNGDLIIILDGEIIFTGEEDDLDIDQGDNETTFYANGKKYVMIKDLKEKLEIMTNEDFSKLKLDNNLLNQEKNSKNIVNFDIKSKYITQKSLSYKKIKQLNQEKYITQIDKIVNLSKKEKLEVVYNKIQKLKIDNYVIDYLEAAIYLKLVENENDTEELYIKNNQYSLVTEAIEFDKNNNINRVYGDEKDNTLEGLNNKRNIIWGKQGQDSLYGGKLDDIIIIVGDMSNYGKIDTKQTLEFLGFKIEEINGKNFNIYGSPKVIDGGDGKDILFITGDIDLSKTDIKGIEDIIIH